MQWLKNNALWVLYFGFASVMLATHQSEPIVSTLGPYGEGKALVWLILLIFLAYSLYCNNRENFFKSMRALKPYYWFRQISIDLYLGLLIPLTLIYLSTGSLMVVAIWFVPILLMANLATLLYIALNYQALVGHFV